MCDRNDGYHVGIVKVDDGKRKSLHNEAARLA
jgi:hypothetical protein